MKVAVYGAGIYGKSFLKALEIQKIKVNCFIDQDTNKNTYMGLPVYKIEDINNKDIEIYVSVSLNNNMTIPNTLKKNEFTNIYSFTDSLKKINTVIKELMNTNILWMRENNIDFIDKEKSQNTISLLKDVQSKSIYTDIINFRKTLDMRYYTFPNIDQIQYFPNDIDIFANIDSIRLVDCGAFIGDTVKATMEYSLHNNIDISSIISFEADERNIAKLNLEIDKQKEISLNTEYIVFPAGVWSQNTILNFSNDGNSASSILDKEDENNIKIPVFSLDSTLKGTNINYIKMDIEGAEQEAIKGAKDILKEKSPILAISVYHNPKDLWEIPLLIESINPNYNMYLRVYGHLGLETILYCIPK